MDVLLTIFTLVLARVLFSEAIKIRRQERAWERYWKKYEAEQAPLLLKEQKTKLSMGVDHEF